jgi:hypothetical protein
MWNDAPVRTSAAIAETCTGNCEKKPQMSHVHHPVCSSEEAFYEPQSQLFIISVGCIDTHRYVGGKGLCLKPSLQTEGLLGRKKQEKRGEKEGST